MVGIEWRDKAWNGEAVNGREDMRGKRHSRGALLDFRGRDDFRERGRLYWSIFPGEGLKTAFSGF